MKIARISETIYDTFDIVICNAILALVCFTQCKLFSVRSALKKGYNLKRYFRISFRQPVSYTRLTVDEDTESFALQPCLLHKGSLAGHCGDIGLRK